MRILFLGGDFNKAGGTERVAALVANGLSEAGHDVILTSMQNGGAPFFSVHNDIKITSLFKTTGKPLLRAPLIVFKLRKLLIEKRVDVLIVVESMSVLFTLPALVGLPINHVCWEHFNFKVDLGKRGRRIARLLAAQFCDSVVTLTERDRQYWLDGTKHKHQITTISNPSPFAVQDNVYNEDAKVVLAVGRLVSQKGFDYLLQAWIHVVEFAPDWRLKIVGEGKDRENLAQFIVDNGLNNSVELLGNTDNVQKYYEKASIFCLSSRFEGFGMVLIEALAFGLPVVSFDCEVGPAEILERTGSILVEPYDIKMLASGLIELIENPKLRQAISLRSKQKANAYQLPDIIQTWDDLILKL